jgi:hypothetical protein
MELGESSRSGEQATKLTIEKSMFRLPPVAKDISLQSFQTASESEWVRRHLVGG